LGLYGGAVGDFVGLGVGRGVSTTGLGVAIAPPGDLVGLTTGEGVPRPACESATSAETRAASWCPPKRKGVPNAAEGAASDASAAAAAITRGANLFIVCRRASRLLALETADRR